MKRLFLIAMFVCIHAAAVAQEQTMRVNGLIVGNDYTQEEIFQAMGGEPTKIKAPQPNEELKDAYIFYYGEDSIEWAEGCVYAITLNTSRHAFNDSIRVGDSRKKIRALGGKSYRSRDVITWIPDHGAGLSAIFHIEHGKIRSINISLNPY